MRHAIRAVLPALLLACAPSVVAQDAKTRDILEQQRQGLEEGSDKMADGLSRLETRNPWDVEALAHGMSDVAEGFCTMVNSNADAFDELGLDFGGLVGSAGGGENAARYEAARAECGQMQATAGSFALTGCTDLVVGGSSTLTIKGDSSGKYRFSASQPGVLSIAEQGTSATLTAAAPGIVTVKAERTDKGRGIHASEVVYSLQVRSINAGQPVRIGLYDAKGRRIPRTDVPVDVVPAGAARRVIYRPAADLLTATGDAGTTLSLYAHQPGTTTVQAMTACGQTTGAPLQVEILPCTDEVRAQLYAERDRLHKRRDNILSAINDVLTDPEFERAMREFEEHARELATKTAELVIGAAGMGKVQPGALSKFKDAAQKAKDYFTALKMAAEGSNAAGHANKVLGADSTTAAGRTDIAGASIKATGDALAGLADQVSKPLLAGFIKTVMEASMAAQDVGQDIGTTLGAVDRLQELDAQLDAVIKELEDVWRRLDLCKEKRSPQDEPSAPEPKPDAAPPPGAKSRGAPPPDEGAPPKQAKMMDLEDNDSPPEGDTPVKPDKPEKPEKPEKPDKSKDGPEPPGSPASASVMADLMFEKQCPGWEPVAQKQSGIFTALGRNVRALGDFYSTQQTQVLEPLAEQLEGTQQALQLLVDASKLTPDQRTDKLDQARDLLTEHDPDKLTQYESSLEALSVQSQACSGLLRNSFEVKIEELRMRY